MGRFIFGLKSVNCDGPRGIALLAVCAALLLLAVAGPGWVAHLRYERAGIAGGQWWRLLTGHLVHLSAAHAVLNVAGLTLLWMLFAREYSPARWGLIILAAIVAIDLGLWVRDTDIAWYVGASGVLHGAMAAGTLGRMRGGDREGWILAAALVGKLFYEQVAGAMPFSSGIGVVIVNAHLYGAVGGFLGALPRRHRWPL